MQRSMKKALLAYGKAVKKGGMTAGEAVIRKHESRYPDFRRWAYALGVMLCTSELLEDKRFRPVAKE